MSANKNPTGFSRGSVKKVLILFLVLFLLIGCKGIPNIIKDTSCEFNDEKYEEGKTIEKEDVGIFYEMKCEDGQWTKIKKIDYLCKPYIENGPNNFNIIFINNLDLDFENIVDELTESLFDYEPFSSYKNKFNIYLIYGNLPKYADDVEVKEIKKISEMCPISNPYIILLDDYKDVFKSHVLVISDENVKLEYMILFTKILDKRHTLKRIFVHEFGHLFSRLDDEYIVEDINQPLFGGGNCDNNMMFVDNKPICNKWPSYTGCFQGCTHTNYYRSSYDSIMKGWKSEDLSLGFNVVSQMILKNKLDPPPIQSFTSQPQYITEKTIGVIINWDGKKINISDIRIVKDKIRPPTDKGKYTLKILNYYNEALYVTRFDIMKKRWCTYGGECHIEDMKSFIITLPYFPWSRKIMILEDDKIIALQDIGFRSVSEGSREGINKTYPVWWIIGIIIFIIIFKDKILKTLKATLK